MNSFSLQHSKAFKRERTHPVMETESMTEQSHGNSVEIHHILKKYRAQGIDLFNDNVLANWWQEVNLVDAPDFQEAQNMIARANELFMQVPSDIRADFDNDPGQFIEFMSDPENREEIEEYGFDASHLGGASDTPPTTPSPQGDQGAPATPTSQDSQNPGADPAPAEGL